LELTFFFTTFLFLPLKKKKAPTIAKTKKTAPIKFPVEELTPATALRLY
jgi:hypothetical protein